MTSHVAVLCRLFIDVGRSLMQVLVYRWGGSSPKFLPVTVAAYVLCTKRRWASHRQTPTSAATACDRPVTDVWATRRLGERRLGDICGTFGRKLGTFGTQLLK